MLVLCCKQTAHLGSNWNNGTNAGTFNWNLNNATSNVNRNISTRLTYLSYRVPIDLASWQNRITKRRIGRSLRPD